MYIFSQLIALIFALNWFIQSADAHRQPHVCKHDNEELTRNLPPEYFESIKDMGLNRNLGPSDAKPLRVTLDFSYLDNPAWGITYEAKEYIKKIMFASKLFLENFIKVIPRQTPVKRRNFSKCIDIEVPPSLMSTGVSNSDLHILVTYENDSSSGGLANAGACEYDPGPIIGRAKFNIGTMKNIGTSPEGFDGDFSTAIHEITHILGFSGGAMQYWIDPDTGKPYLGTVGKIQIKDTVRGKLDVIKLKSKNVLETARRYFNCPTLQSFALENQGGSGSFGSHWERDLLQNEYMTASAVLGKAIISQFTAALLMDTGFYAEINSNMVEKIYWGEGKGCEFVEKACDSATQFPEFSPDSKEHCDFHSMGFGQLATDSFSQCQVSQPYSNTKCFDDVGNPPYEPQRSNTGPGSKCFRSTAFYSKYVYKPANDNGCRCHKYVCNADKTVIDVQIWKNAQGEAKAQCTAPNQVIDLTNKTLQNIGALTCPSNFDLFCDFPKYCNNFCFGNGICQNGVCYCLEGFVSEDCSKTCPIPQVWDGTKCILECTAGTFLNPDKTCKATCPAAYYGNSTTKTCDLCEKTCSICTGPTNKECSKCNDPYKLSGTSCVDPSQATITCDSTCLTCTGSNNNQCSSCSDGRFLDSNKMCSLCTSPCKTCKDSATKCNSCISADYSYDSATSTCKQICDASCLTCSAPKDATKCQSCSDGKFLQNGQCIACKTPCAKCIDKEDKCTDCITNYKYDSAQNKCNITCDSSCLTCSAPLDNTKCLTCKDGYFISSGKCLQCTSPCSKCNLLATTCTECVADYSYNSQNNTCSPICDGSCKTCSAPKNSKKCSSCIDGFYLDKITFECKQCTSPCATCLDSATSCLSCISSTDYTYDSTNKVCNIVCDTSCKTCTKPKDSTACTSCIDGKYIDTNQCKNCNSPCKTCETSSTNCKSCETNYTLNGNSCTPSCHSTCKTCTKPIDQNSCSSCLDGFVLDGTKCTQCSSPCKNCIDNVNKCTSCISLDYTFDQSKNICNPVCDSSCKTCSKPKDASSCLGCNDGFYLSSGLCKKCDSPCATCDTSSTFCKSCITNFNYNQTQNNCTPICDSTCKTCDKPADPNSCKSCNDGSFLDGTKCTKCTPPCLNCVNSAAKCTSCISSDYTLDLSQNLCNSVCDGSCKTCLKPKDATSCQTCFDGAYLSSGSCLKCTSPCANCEVNDKKCLSCVSNYTYDGSKNLCNPNCDLSCKTCTKPIDSNSCSSCNDGSYLDGTKCSKCTSPCANCEISDKKCLSCVNNYTLDNSKNVCNPNCEQSCKSCTKPADSNSCLSCNDGSFLDGTKCSKCTSPCLTCVDNPLKCNTCISQDYKFDNQTNKCNPVCDSTCKTCSTPKDPFKCLDCLDGFFLSNGQCKKCKDPCGNCIDSESKCLTCSQTDKYTINLTTNTCNPVCDSLCKQCSAPKDPLKCTDCNEGMFLNLGQCQTCKSPCKNCVDNESKCTSCISADYTYNQTKNICEPVCDTSCKTCNAPKDSSKCTSCADGQFLDNGTCKKCSSPCATCDTKESRCISCIVNYKINQSANSCEPECDPSCKTCSDPKNPSKCLSCFDTNYLDSSGSCQKCDQPCVKCETNSKKCLTCQQNFTFNSSNNICEPICDSSCKTCKNPNDANSCLSCKDGSFLDGSKCTPCLAPCKTCQDNSSKCLTCISDTDYTFEQTNNKCKPVCDSTCQACVEPKNPLKCTSCGDGSYLENSQCKKCKAPCQNCEITATKCLSCINNKYTFDGTNNQCKSNCHDTCKSCTQPDDATKCSSCFDGFYLDGSSCKECTSPCDNCEITSTKCLSCEAGYQHLQSNNTCEITCDKQCKTCDKPLDSKSCKSCFDGFFLSGTECMKCASPCQNCVDQATKCQSCVSNTDYKFDSSGNKCDIVCHSSCKSCIEPNNAQKCKQCPDGFYLENGECKKCASPCGNCEISSNSCLTCINADYTFDSSKKICNPVCDSSCKTCSAPKDGTKCLSCSDGFYLEGNTCKKCASPCQKCINNQNNCTQCETGYNLNINKCEMICDISCKTCSKPNDSNSCQSCSDGNFLDGSKCSKCNSPCANCIENASKCLKCIPGDYTFNSQTNKCENQCDSTCKTCSKSKDANSCLSCYDDSFLDGTKCSKCTSPCGSCVETPTKCLSCVNIEYTFNQTKNICEPVCDITCKTCSSPKDASKCLTCNEGSYIEQGRCKNCQQPCKTCTENATKCLSCIDTNYNFDTQKNICTAKCHASCKTCSSPADENKCDSCFDGSFKDGTKCSKCQAPCGTCIDSATKCLTCVSSDYTLDSAKNICNSNCDASCKTCSGPKDPSKCTSCQDGLYLDAGQCKKCSSPCVTCQNTNSFCLSCETGYSLEQNNTGKCIASCHSSCNTCSKPNDSNSCLSCKDGSFLKANQCLPCISACSKCVDFNDKCTECKTDFTLNQSTCSPICDSSCKTCSEPKNPLKCLTCNDTTFFIQDQCQKCQQPCQNCKETATKCLSCISNDFAYDSTQFKCTSNCHSSCKSCSTPSSDSSCTSCFDGFYLDGNKCTACETPCYTCTSKDLCKTCISGYIIQNNKCSMSCHPTCKTCNKPNDPNTCNSCNDGFFLDGNKCSQCKQPCGKCETNSTKCLSCISTTDYQFDSSLNTCQPICHQTCATCSAPNNSTSCLTCRDGYFHDKSKNSCIQCTSPCKNCESSTGCLSCVSNDYSYDSASKKCKINCDTNCLTCLPTNTKQCLSCQDGTFLTPQSSCEKCQNPCETCQKNSSTCLTCLKGFKLSQQTPNTCEPTCDDSCLTCQVQNPQTCLSCYNGRYLDLNICKECPANCSKCTSSKVCTECKVNYALNASSNSCEPLCHTSCLTCQKPNDPSSCLTCPSNKFLKSGSCIGCSDGYFYKDQSCSPCLNECKTCSNLYSCQTCKEGYQLSPNNICTKITATYKCHYTCQKCVGTSFSHCTSCVENRVLNIKSSDYSSSKVVGTCDCPSGTSDFNKPMCDKSAVQQTVKTTTTAFYVSSAATTTLLSIATANPLIMVSLIEFSQTISFFTYVNEKPAMGFDGVANNLYTAHFTKLFNFGSLSQQQSRILQNVPNSADINSDSNGFKNNSKIPLNEKYPQFVVNALSILVLTGFVWIVSSFSSVISMQDPNSCKAKVKKVLCISLPICIFVLTSQEFSLLIFYQFQQLEFETSLDQASSLLTFIVLAYIISFLAYLFYKLEYQKVLTKPMSITSSVYETNAKVHPIFGPEIQKTPVISNMDYFTFYILSLYINQNTFLNRNFVQIMVIRKIVTSLIMTYGFKDALSQMILLMVLYLFYWIYIIFSKPFKQLKHRIIYSLVETITLIMHILYVILLSNSSDTERQKNISFAMLVLILCTLLIYMIVTFIYLAIYTLQLIKKCGEQKKYDNVVMNVSHHFGQNQSALQLKEDLQESKIYSKGVDPLQVNQVQLIKQASVPQEILNSSVLHNNSISHEYQNNLIASKSIMSDRAQLESPMRLRQAVTPKDHFLDSVLRNNQSSTKNNFDKANNKFTNSSINQVVSNNEINKNDNNFGYNINNGNNIGAANHNYMNQQNIANAKSYYENTNHHFNQSKNNEYQAQPQNKNNKSNIRQNNTFKAQDDQIPENNSQNKVPQFMINPQSAEQSKQKKFTDIF